MKFRSIVTAVAVFLVAGTAAARPLTVEQAMTMARERSEGVQAAKAGVRRARAQVRAAKSGWWPQLAAVISYERTLASEFDDISFGPPVDPSAPDTDDDDEGLGDLPFGQDNVWRIGLALSQELWSFGRTKGRVKIARSAEAQAEINESSVAAQAALAAAEAYYDALLFQELVKIAELTFAQAEETLRITELGFKEGAMPEFDVLRARVTRENEASNVTLRRAERDIAVLRLKRIIGLPLTEEVDLTTPLEKGVDRIAGKGETPPVDADLVADAERAAARRAPVRLAAESVRLNEHAVGLARASHWPNLTLVSNFGPVNYPNSFYVGISDWRTNWTVGVNLAIPIFTGWRIAAEVDAARADLSASRYRLEETRRSAVVDAVASDQALDVASATWLQTTRTVSQAERAYAIAELRFEQGISTYVDLVASRLLLDQSRVVRARAARTVQVARIRLDLLPDLPLGFGTPPTVESAQTQSPAVESAP